MAPPRPSLARSTTSTRTLSRPLSAHSTHSTDSNATQPLATASFGQHHPLIPQQAWPQQQQTQQQQQQHQHHANALQFQAHQQMIAQNNTMQQMMEPHMQAYPSLSYTQANFSFNDRMQSPAVSSVEGDLPGAVEGGEPCDAPKKKGSGASQANDQELRRLFRENGGRSLLDVASEVKREEKGPKAEKSKQVFGMLWLFQSIKKSNQSVPRNRVYSSYANRCGDDSLPLLNPASFGKLVRIIFPNVQTRRLGVRGESKYHYVNLSLVNDDGRGSVPPGGMTIKPEVSRAPSLMQPQLSAASDKAGFPGCDSPVKPVRPAQRRYEPGVSSLYLQHAYRSADEFSIPKRDHVIGRVMRWPDAAANAIPDGTFELPNIEQYLPPGTDLDAASSLAAVYRSHCLQVVDHFRYCKTDAFCDSFKTMIGLLTVPSQKLLGREELVPWIEACDRIKYQKMIPLLRNILLAAVPAAAMAHMDLVANSLCSWISQFFAGQPQHVQEAMLRPASAFVSILSRFIRVNRAAHDVSKVLHDEEARTELWTQWVEGSQPIQIIEGACDPNTGGHHRLLNMLTQEFTYILQPSDESLDALTNPLFMERHWEGKQTPGFLAFKASEEMLESTGTNGTIFERLPRFLTNLPTRFPGVPARDILRSVETAMGIAGRNLSLNATSQALTHFFTVSRFITEMLYWQAEIGGFFAPPAVSVPLPAASFRGPYTVPNSMTSSAPTDLSGTRQMPVQSENYAQSVPDKEKAKQLHNKLLSLQNNFSLPGDANSTSKNPRVSLGGETMVGDDDFQLDASMSWDLDHTGNFFDNQDTSGVAVR